MSGRRVLALALSGALTAPLYALDAQVNFQLQCMGCHHADGAGEAGRVPSIRKTLVPWSVLLDGRDFIMRVPGVAQSPLSDSELAALLNWMIRNLSDLPVPADFVNYTPTEVGRARRRPLAAVAQMRDRLTRSSNAP